MVHILTYEGAKVNSSRPHGASVTCLRLDEENDFVATASVEGKLNGSPSLLITVRSKLTIRPSSNPVSDEYGALRFRLQTTYARCCTRAWVQQEDQPVLRLWWNGRESHHAGKGMAGLQGASHPFGRRADLGDRVERGSNRLGE